MSPEGARRLLELINRSRADRGLPPMSHRADVASIAVDHSRAMAKAGDIWHNDSYFSADTKRRLGARTVGENVAMNNSIDDAHARLMASPGHRANILNPAFVVAGIGVVQRNGGSYYITEDFVEPLSAATPKPATPAAERPRGAPAPKAAAAAAAPTTTEAVAPPTTERREHFPNGIASTTSQPRRLNAGAGPSDTRSAVLFVAVALLTLVGATAGRRMLRRRAGA